MINKFEPHYFEVEMSSKMYVYAVYDDPKGLRIVLQGDNSDDVYYILNFERYYGYRNFNESERYRLFSSHKEVTQDWSVFTGEGTEFSQWLIAQSGGLLDGEKMIHLLIVTPEDIIDVLAPELPRVSEISNHGTLSSTGG